PSTTVLGNVYAGGNVTMTGHVKGSVQAGGTISGGTVDGARAQFSPPAPPEPQDLPAFTWDPGNYPSLPACPSGSGSQVAWTAAISMSNNVTLPDDVEVVYYAKNGSVKFNNLKHFTGAVYASSITLDQQFTLTFQPVTLPGFNFDLASSTHFTIQAGSFKEVPFS